MWQKLMRTWLIGAAVTLATPEGTMRAESNIPNDKIAESGESDTGNRPMTVYAGEPSLGELLADPICQALMHRDGVTSDNLSALISDMQAGQRYPEES
jgi:hypothetical protein